MQLHISWKNDTEAHLKITASTEELTKIKATVLKNLSGKVKVAGFRAGHVPAEVVEKQIDNSVLQSEFLDEALTTLYTSAAKQEKLRPVDRPQVSVTKFVPFTELEFELTVPCIGDITLPDYKKISSGIQEEPVKVTDEEIENVIDNLKKRSALKNVVDRAAKDGDQVWIDFEGKNAKGEPVKGADGKDYPLILGSNTFIPGFEPALVGLKATEQKTFPVTFPKDYGAKELQGKKVSFTVTVNKVEEVVEPVVDDAFAAQAGPFKSVDELKAAIRQQLEAEKHQQAHRDHEAAVVKAVTDKSKVAIPEVLITDQIDRLVTELKQQAVYRGMTWDEFLTAEGKTEEEYKNTVVREEATDRVKAGLVLSEIADNEKLTITAEELDARIKALKTQYDDDAMRKQLDEPENRRDIATRMLTEKTIHTLTGTTH